MTVEVKKVSDTITSVGDNVRIETGPVRKRAVATKELLGDATASHYHLPITEEVDGKKEVKVAIDALGKPIEEGKEFDYIDWRNDARAYYVYQKDANGVWQSKGAYDSVEEAMGNALQFASAPAATPKAKA